jgi:hypothetical protein
MVASVGSKAHGRQIMIFVAGAKGEIMSEYIGREEVIKILEHYDLSSGSTIGCHSGAIECAISAIEMLPAADVAPVVRGRWIEEDGIQICSECGEEHEWEDYRAPYCDTCGAKMNKEEADELD